MSGWKKLAAASAAGGGVDVDDVFSTYLYTGNGTSQTITNGLDLAGDGGLIWSKYRSGSGHLWYDTQRGIDYVVSSSSSEAQYDYGGDVTSVNSDGFSLGYYSGGVNYSGRDYVTWSFRKAPKFFDIVTYNGNSTARTISHNLGQKPGMIIIKALNNVRDWAVWHKDLVNDNGFLMLNTTNTESADSAVFTTTDPTSTVFSIGTDLRVNYSSFSYVAYVFADNNGEGEFGPDSDQDIIKCGSYTGNGSNSGPIVDVGFEPQFLLIKGSNQNWVMIDTMRGLTRSSANTAFIFANSTNAEFEANWFNITNTGFQPADNSSSINQSGQNYIYMAIRRGPLAPPESGTDVFSVSTGAGTSKPTFGANSIVDMALRYFPYTGVHDVQLGSRLFGKLYGGVNDPSPFYSDSNQNWDYMDGFYDLQSDQPTWLTHMWKRAPGFFDVVAYNGNSTAGHNITHNLGVAPEMMWVKRRDTYNGVQQWVVYHEGFDPTNPAHKYARLNNDDGVIDEDGKWNDTAPTASVFTVGNHADVNNVNGDYMAFLFATLSGVSKVGSYTGNGSSQTIDCGFSSGARFVLIKDTDSNGEWQVYDTVRGIVTGNSPFLELNTSSAQVTGYDLLDPASSGFAVNNVAGGYNINLSGQTYAFYAVA